MIWFLVIFAVIIFLLSVKVVKEYDRGVIFFLGRCTGVRGPGLILLIPLLEQMTKVTLRTITMEIPSQKIITKDNVSIDIAAVAYYHIVDPKNLLLLLKMFIMQLTKYLRPLSEMWSANFSSINYSQIHPESIQKLKM